VPLLLLTKQYYRSNEYILLIKVRKFLNHTYFKNPVNSSGNKLCTYIIEIFGIMNIGFGVSLVSKEKLYKNLK